MDYMEEMAREYNHALRNASVSDFDNAIDILEREIDIVSAAIFCGRQENKALAYFLSLQRLSLLDLYNLKNGKELPYARRRQAAPRGMNALIDLQIDLLTELDILKDKNYNVDSILEREDRATAVLGLAK